MDVCKEARKSPSLCHEQTGSMLYYCPLTCGHPDCQPTNEPTNLPSMMPTNLPSILPTYLPSNVPSTMPSNMPTIDPTHVPINVPSSAFPSMHPTSIQRLESELFIYDDTYQLAYILSGIFLFLLLLNIIAGYFVAYLKYKTAYFDKKIQGTIDQKVMTRFTNKNIETGNISDSQTPNYQRTILGDRHPSISNSFVVNGNSNQF